MLRVTGFSRCSRGRQAVHRRLVVAVAVLALVGGVASVAMSAPPLLGETKSTAVSVGISSGNTWNNADNPHSLRQSCGSDKNSHVFWFKWFNNVDTDHFAATTDGSSIDTVLSVYENGKRIGCDDDGGLANNDSRVEFDAVQGKTYYFAVTSYDGEDGGDFVFNLYG
jgi:hypothetical protein